MKEVMYAFGFFEIGDQYYDENKIQHTITDVLICYYVKSDTYKVLYELDHSQEFVHLIRPTSVKEVPEPVPASNTESNGRLLLYPDRRYRHRLHINETGKNVPVRGTKGEEGQET